MTILFDGEGVGFGVGLFDGVGIELAVGSSFRLTVGVGNFLTVGATDGLDIGSFCSTDSSSTILPIVLGVIWSIIGKPVDNIVCGFTVTIVGDGG